MSSGAVSKISSAEIRAATKWLKRRNISSKELSPKKFARAAKILDKSFMETLRILAGEQGGGQV